jgi:hypothetical protein
MIPCRKLFPKKTTKFWCQFILGFFLIAFSGVSQRWEFKFKNTTKNVLQKNRAEKFLQKNRPKNPKPVFFLDFVHHVFGRFSVRENKSGPGPFFGVYPAHPPRGPPNFFLGAGKTNRGAEAARGISPPQLSFELLTAKCAMAMAIVARGTAASGSSMVASLSLMYDV